MFHDTCTVRYVCATWCAVGPQGTGHHKQRPPRVPTLGGRSALNLTVDDMVGPPVAEDLGEGIIPTAAVLVVATISEDGNGLRFMLSDGLVSWNAIGMLRSILNRLKAEDLSAWGDDD